MQEYQIVKKVVDVLRKMGFRVATEVANFYRSADIAAIAENGDVWIIECKVSNIKQALRQLNVHKNSADRVFIATTERTFRKETLELIKGADVGLITISEEGSFDVAMQGGDINPWIPAKIKIIDRINER